jgi:hypothetical protein
MPGMEDIDALSDAEDNPLLSEAHSIRRLAKDRNEQRFKTATEEDQKILSKYLPNNTSAFLPDPILGPSDAFQAPLELLTAVAAIASTPSPTPAASPIQFDISPKNLEANTKLLEETDYDITRFLAQHQHTTLGFGSEFRPIEQLRQVLGKHPHFPELTSILEKGMPYIYSNEISEETRNQEVQAMLTRGNHKSAEEESEQVKRLLLKDVHHGFSIPVLPEIVHKIQGAMVQPLGLAKQFSLDAAGTRVPKYRLTQDLSFSLSGKNLSVNSRINMGSYIEMIYGWCINRVIHFMVSLREEHPTTKIFIAKYDYSDAYRRIAHSATAAAQSISVIGGVAYIALRLTFGGSPNPPTWCTFSEMVTDLANEIGSCPTWDPEQLRSPAQPVTPTPSELSEEIPFGQARQTAVKLPPNSNSRTDGFIDDLITIFLDTPNNRRRSPHVVPLAMHVTSRPHAGHHEPIARRNILSDAKLIAEGTPAEIQIVLGWQLNGRLLAIALPDDKFDAWSSDTKNMIKHRSTTFGELDTTVGRFNHAAHIIPLARHFLNRLRLRIQVRIHAKRKIKFSLEETEDLKLWLTFLASAHQGISLNKITTRQPSRISWSDACPHGIGGYLLSGRAWRIRIPSSSPLRGLSIFNNLFEFLGMVINIWLECLHDDGSEECLLALGDNTSAIGWLFRSSQLDGTSIYYAAVQIAARHLATLLINSSHCLASQHLKGELNIVADLLSYEGTDRHEHHPLAPDNPSDDELTHRFHTFLPQLIPHNFKISPLPNDILCWTMQVLHTAELSLMQSKSKATNPRTVSGDDGSHSAPIVALPETHSSLLYPKTNVSSSFEPSSASIVMLNGASQVNLLENVRSQWLQALCAMPQAVWLRRFGSIYNQAPCTSRTALTCVPPSEPSSEPLITPIPSPSGKKQSLPNCCDTCTPLLEPEALNSAILLPP